MPGGQTILLMAPRLAIVAPSEKVLEPKENDTRKEDRNMDGDFPPTYHMEYVRQP